MTDGRRAEERPWRRETFARRRRTVQLHPAVRHPERDDDQGQETVHLHAGRHRLFGRDPVAPDAAPHLQERGG